MKTTSENPGPAIMAEKIDTFFDLYEQRFNDFIQEKDTDAHKTAEAFTENFIAASPSGIMCGKKGAEFNTAIESGYVFYRSNGLHSMEILSKDIEILDEMHAIAKLRWKSGYTGKDGNSFSIDFEIIYLVRLIEGICRIFCYITGDEQKALKEYGIIKH